MAITIEVTLAAPLSKVWNAWITPEDIMQWNAASDDWHTTRSTVDFRVGGTFSSRMEAKDGSMGFDFWGTYTQIVPHSLIETELGDHRKVRVEFIESPAGVTRSGNVRARGNPPHRHATRRLASDFRPLRPPRSRVIPATTIPLVLSIHKKTEAR